MRNVWRIRIGLLLAIVAGGALLLAGSGAAQARPQYRTQFQKQYTKVAENNKITCLVCHQKKDGADTPDTKARNNYGQALMAVIEKNEKSSGKIIEALEKVEPEDSAIAGKTFGDLLEEGKLPAGTE